MNSALNDSCTQQHGVVVPHELIYVCVQEMTDEAFLTGSQVHYHQSVLVALITVALHRRPRDPLAVGRVFRIRVVALVVRGDIALLACVHVIKEDVAVGRYGIFQPRFLAASVGDLFVVGIPSQLLNAAEGLHRTLERGALEDVHAFTDFGGLDTFTFTIISDLQRTYKRLRSGFRPLVPVLVHQVVVHVAGCER